MKLLMLLLILAFPGCKPLPISEIPLFVAARPLDEAAAWQMSGHRLETPYELRIRRLVRGTALETRQDLRLACYLETPAAGSLWFAGLYRTPHDGSAFAIPIHYRLTHWFRLSAGTDALVARLLFYDRQHSRLQKTAVPPRRQKLKTPRLHLDPPDFSNAATIQPAHAAEMQACFLEPHQLFLREITPPDTRPGEHIRLRHYWMRDSRPLLLEARSILYRRRKTIPVNLAGEHWFLLQTNRGNTVCRLYYDQPGLLELIRMTAKK